MDKIPKPKFKRGDEVREIAFPDGVSTISKVSYIFGMWHYWYIGTSGWNTEYEIEIATS